MENNKMRVIETKKIMISKEITTNDENFCDKCGANVKSEIDCYDVYKCDIKIKTGVSYPEGGSGEYKTIDLCQKCSEEFLTLLNNNGYRINIEEWDSY
jgi:hypothetical protein